MRLILTLLLGLFVFGFSQAGYRYTDTLFVPIQTHTNLTYASAPELNYPYTGESSIHSSELKLHVFQPDGDTLSTRPLLICAHGGAFITGTKEHDDMMEFCRIYAKKGYVTATIQYRLGMNVASSVSGERSVYRALQDSRAAIRYFQHNAGIFNIDPDKIYFLGSSAGAFMTLHNIFMNEESERPVGSFQVTNVPPTLDDGPDLGVLDAIESSNLGSGHPRGIISLWGALQDTSLIKPADSGIPVLLIHGKDDDIVPFGVGSPFGASSLPPTYGSGPISTRLENLGFEYKTYFLDGEGHEFYGVTNGNWDPAPNAYWDTVNVLISDFLYQNHKPDAGFSHSINGSEITFTDLSNGATKWHWDFGDEQNSVEQNPIHTYSSDGSYSVKQIVFNHLDSWDTVSTIINITTTGIDDANMNIPGRFYVDQNYPNPFNPTTTIRFGLPKSSDLKIELFNLLGQKIITIKDEFYTAGYHSVQLDASQIPTGTYFYRVQAGQNTIVRKMQLIK